MPTLGAPDFTSATPAPGAAAAAIIGAATSAVQGKQAINDANEQNQYANSVETQRTLPQLQSSIGANGQEYSGARKNALAFSAQDALHQDLGVNSALQRQLNDLNRQQAYAAIGLIV